MFSKRCTETYSDLPNGVVIRKKQYKGFSKKKNKQKMFSNASKVIDMDHASFVTYLKYQETRIDPRQLTSSV